MLWSPVVAIIIDVTHEYMLDLQLPLNVFVMTFQFHPGKNVGLGKDHTIFSLIDGLVKFEKFGPDRKQVSC